MPPRRLNSCPLSLILFLVISTATVWAQDGGDLVCHPTVGKRTFDLASLAGDRWATRMRETPPSKVVDVVRFDLCADLPMLDNVKESDQCPTGTRACLTETNQKPSESDRVTTVIPLARSSSLQPNITYSSSSSPQTLTIILHGVESYPPQASPPVPQSLNMTLACASGWEDPMFVGYEAGRASVLWKVPIVCTSEEGGGGEKNEKKKKVGSGIGFFFLVLLLALAAYFGLGAYYNYTTYGATGADLLPHRDFWKEVPYLLKDVISHLCLTVRGSRPVSRGGYISV